MFRLVLSSLAVALLASPAFAFWAKNGMEVTPVDNNTFVVQFMSVENEKQYLCAAGDYVIRALGLSTRTRFYRESPAPRKSGEGITFTLDPARKVPMRMFNWLWVDDDDGGISVVNARSSYCFSSRGDWR